MKRDKQLLDEVFMISAKPKAEVDNTDRHLDYLGYHKKQIK